MAGPPATDVEAMTGAQPGTMPLALLLAAATLGLLVAARRFAFRKQ
jgi:hypothetical protein